LQTGNLGKLIGVIRKDNGPEPVATIPQCRCQRRGDLQWRSKRKRPRLREAPLDESQTCSVRKSHAIAASSSQRSFGKTFLKAFECAKNRDERIRALQTTARERISRECP